jgi:hypothetical protein
MTGDISGATLVRKKKYKRGPVFHPVTLGMTSYFGLRLCTRYSECAWNKHEFFHH